MKKGKLWFKAKMFGWGWYPVSWEGYLILAMYLLGTVLNFINVDRLTHSISDTLINFSLPFVINTIFLLIICYAKGERPRWRWGK